MIASCNDDVYRSLREANPRALVAKGLSAAYVGHTSGPRPIAVYDYEQCIAVVMDDLGLSRNEAVSHLVRHTIPDEVGRDLPVFVIFR